MKITFDKIILKRYLSEFIGTFFLVFFGCGSVVVNDVTGGSVSHVGICICWGFVVFILIYSLGRVSGTHINPAVTIAFMSVGQLKPKDAVGYVISQTGGAILAALVLKVIFPEHDGLGGTFPQNSDLQSFVLEFIMTYFLMFVIFNMSDPNNKHSDWSGFVIGMVILLEAMFGGPISGASMNPARSLGPALISMNFKSLWVYLVAPVAGALCAYPTYAITRK